MSCGRFRPALMDVALGAEAPEAEAHAASCSSCGETLSRLRTRVSHMDAELRVAGAAQPGPYFQSRVRARLEAERAARPAPLRFLLPATASLAAVLLGLLLLRRQPAAVPTQTASLTPREPGAAAAPAARPTPEAVPVAARPRPAQPGRPSPAVLVDPAEGAALSALAARLDSGRTRPESLQLPEAESKDMKEIAIAPLDVRALDATPALEDSSERSPS